MLTRIVIPHFNTMGVYPYMDRLPFGATYYENIAAVIHNPQLLAKLFFTPQKMMYSILFLAPLVFLPLLSPRHYILIFIPLIKNLLADSAKFSGFFTISSHYTATVLPFVYIAGIYGAGWLIVKAKSRHLPLVLAIAIILSSVAFFGKTDGHKLGKFIHTIHTERTLEKISYLSVIPKDASVAANFGLVPQLSHRKYVFEWNPAYLITEYIVIDTEHLEYLPQEDISRMDRYFREMKENGYRTVFLNPQGTFFILHKPDIDRKLIPSTIQQRKVN